MENVYVRPRSFGPWALHFKVWDTNCCVAKGRSDWDNEQRQKHPRKKSIWDETKLGPRNWNPCPRKLAEALVEAEADRLIVEGPQKKNSMSNKLDEFLFGEAPRKQNQLTDHLRKLKLWSRKQSGRQRGRHIGVEENGRRFPPPLEYGSGPLSFS